MTHRFTRWMSAAALLTTIFVAGANPARAANTLSHDVFFALKDNSEAARGKLVAACQKSDKGTRERCPSAWARGWVRTPAT